MGGTLFFPAAIMEPRLVVWMLSLVDHAEREFQVFFGGRGIQNQPPVVVVVVMADGTDRRCDPKVSTP